MLKTFRSKELAKFWAGGTSKIDTRLHDRIQVRLDALDVAGAPEDMNVPGWNFHGLHGKPKRYSFHVNGPWWITFGFEDGNAVLIDLEQYH